MSALPANMTPVLEKMKHSTTVPASPAARISEKNAAMEAGRRAGKLLIIVEKQGDWANYLPSESLITAQDYLAGGGQASHARVRVINLCRSYKYLSHGYYCSLLAEARGHHAIPSLRTISELAKKSLYGLSLDNLEKVLDKALADHPYGRTEGFTLNLYFGKTDLQPLQELARQLFDAMPCPILQVEFRKSEHWRIAGIRSGSLHKLQEQQEQAFADALDAFNRRIWRVPSSRHPPRYDMAVLHDPDEALPPSNRKALEHFIAAGEVLGIEIDLIGKKDYSRLAEYDALFIRETTSVANHTYRFAKKAESDGLVVMDDPASILRCTNKVYLSDLLSLHGLGRPVTEILYKERPRDIERVGRKLGFPLVLKIPDGCFSRGVLKVESPEQLAAAAEELFQHSVLLLAQEYFYTDYDWRIGVLNRKPLYACQYFMSKGHWQIYNHQAKAAEVNGACRALPIDAVPSAVLELAVQSAALIGDGLYGVDLKQSGDKLVVIEVNDNPNLDAGIEDACLQEDLYCTVLQEFIRRLEIKHSGRAG